MSRTITVTCPNCDTEYRADEQGAYYNRAIDDCAACPVDDAKEIRQCCLEHEEGFFCEATGCKAVLCRKHAEQFQVSGEVFCPTHLADAEREAA